MNRRTRRLRTLLLLGAALLCAGTGLVLMATDALQRADLGSIDARFDRRGANPTPDRVVVVGIDDPPINAPGYTFPFRRLYHAQVIRRLARAGCVHLSRVPRRSRIAEPASELVRASHEAGRASGLSSAARTLC